MGPSPKNRPVSRKWNFLRFIFGYRVGAIKSFAVTPILAFNLGPLTNIFGQFGPNIDHIVPCPTQKEEPWCFPYKEVPKLILLTIKNMILGP